MLLFHYFSYRQIRLALDQENMAEIIKLKFTQRLVDI